MKTKNFKNYVLVLAIVNYWNWLDAIQDNHRARALLLHRALFVGDGKIAFSCSFDLEQGCLACGPRVTRGS